MEQSYETLTDEELREAHRRACFSKNGPARLPAINAEIIRRSIEKSPLPSDPFAGLPR